MQRGSELPGQRRERVPVDSRQDGTSQVRGAAEDGLSVGRKGLAGLPTVEHRGVDSPSGPGVALEHQDAVPRAAELARRGEPGDARSDDDDGAAPASLGGPVASREGGAGGSVEGGVAEVVDGGGGVWRGAAAVGVAVFFVGVGLHRHHPRRRARAPHRAVDPKVDEAVRVQEPPRRGHQRRAALRRPFERRRQRQRGADVLPPEAQHAVPSAGVGGDRGTGGQSARGHLVVRERRGREAQGEARGGVEGDVVGPGGRRQRGEEPRDVDRGNGDDLF